MIVYVIAIGVIIAMMAKSLVSSGNRHSVSKPTIVVGQSTDKKEDTVVNPAWKDLVPLTEVRGCFKRGARHLATVKDVRAEAVEVYMPADKGCGLISARCWGTGEARDEALAALSVGDMFEVIVRAYDSRSKNLSLILPGFEKFMPGRGKDKCRSFRKRKQTKYVPNNDAHGVGEKVPRKLVYHPIPMGTTFLIDTANVIGTIGPEQAAHKLSALENSLVAFGHKTVFFVERRALGWMRENQDQESDVAALEKFFSKANVSKVDDGADLPIIQAAREIPDSVIVSRDHFSDYREAYPDIVGSKRHCTFSFIKIKGKVFFTVCGLRDAIVIEDDVNMVPVCPPMPKVDEPCVTENEVNEVFLWEDYPEPQEKPMEPLSDLRKGLIGTGDAYRAKGDLKKAFACYNRIARNVPAVYFDLAEICAEGDIGNGDANKYVILGERNEKKVRQCAMRRARLRSERRRTGKVIFGMMRAA